MSHDGYFHLTIEFETCTSFLAGRLDDQLGAMAVKNGWQGVLINGCVRDVEILKSMDFGVRALNCLPLKSNKRNQGQFNVALRFAGVSFKPGQYLYADENGIVVAREKLPVKD